jgi:hypothetical protein
VHHLNRGVKAYRERFLRFIINKMAANRAAAIIQAGATPNSAKKFI